MEVGDEGLGNDSDCNGGWRLVKHILKSIPKFRVLIIKFCYKIAKCIFVLRENHRMVYKFSQFK